MKAAAEIPSRGHAERIADVERLLAAARAVHADRARLAPSIALATGLSAEGVELGFESLEREATGGDLDALVRAAGSARRVHVVLSANVFVAPLRALAVARAAADVVTVRPSPRDPVLTRALVDAAGDPAITVVAERDVALTEADEIHVYGRTETVASVRARARPGATVRGHAAGMGIAWITASADLALAAEGLGRDVVAFDQRGCLSPRIAFVEGDGDRARRLASSLCEALSNWAERVPRGLLSEGEIAEATRWRETMAFAGSVWNGRENVVAATPSLGPLSLAPPGRHVLVVSASTFAIGQLATLDRFIVAWGSDDPHAGAALAPAHARVSLLGRMQLPPLDGAVDRRARTSSPSAQQPGGIGL